MKIKRAAKRASGLAVHAIGAKGIEPFRETALQERAIQRLKDTPQSEGLYQAKVHLDVDAS